MDMPAPSSGLLRTGLALKLSQVKLATRSYLRDRTRQATDTVVSYAVAQRTREIGIRLSLGAGRYDVLKLLLGWALSMVALGVITGIVGSVAIARVLSGFLFGIKPTDLITFLAVPLLLGAVALLASYIPARRATRVDPMIALRYE